MDETEPKMASTRLLQTSRTRPMSSAVVPCYCSSMKNNITTIRCITSNKGESVNGKNARQSTPTIVRKASATCSEHLTYAKTHILPGMLASALQVAYVKNVLFVLLKLKLPKLQLQIFIDRVVMNCRFFTLLAVIGSLIGSVLCFVEGCFLILESYVQYFHALSQRMDQGHVITHLIEAIDMFLVGTAMVFFGFSLYMIFVTPDTRTNSDLSGYSHMKPKPSWMGMQCIARAKSKIGHAVMLILHVGLLEKFHTVPLATGLDLACFAATILTSSASVFLLSKLNS